MSDDKARGEQAPEAAEDPTAEFLDDVRVAEEPWRTDRPADQEPASTYAGEVRKQSRLRRAADIAGQAAPYLPLATYAGFVAADALNDDGGDGSDGTGDMGFADYGGGAN